MGSKSMVVDLDTKELRASTGAIARAFEWSRIVHIRLFWHDGLIVRISTISLIVLMLIGMFVAWPRLGRSLSALHKSVAWIGIPLYAAIAVTGVLMSYNITFGGGGIGADEYRHAQRHGWRKVHVTTGRTEKA